jgi:hypothetical protein
MFLDYSDSSDDEFEPDNENNSDQVLSLLSVVRCAAHTIQLAVHDALKKSDCATIRKIRSVVKKLKT